ncbi:MAG: RagB/SusD family nutrient uptake outer membrane protein [Pseudoflavonifractor sp.]|nr:RagB/SusD family nutrient uptake outer membrane protein [Alloprevotella sp.]MCM1116973.1 RagB/SusD family nutrient uptake outer membrane protein [Pseudoflavonifractor sp.]
MKFNNILKSVSMAAILATMAGTSSCDYLEVVPPEVPTAPDAMKTYDRARGYLYSCYNALNGIDNNDYTVGYLAEVNSTTDEYYMPYTWNNDATVLRGTLQNTQSGTVGISDQWNRWYTAIGQCLQFEKNLNETGREYGVAPEAEMAQWLAESRFLKAFYHWSLLRRYGPIPLTRELADMNLPTGSIPGRSHFDYCVEYIINEMEEASKDLPAVRPESEIGRITSTICKSIIGKIRLYAASPLWNGEFPTPQWRNKSGVTTPADPELGTPDYGDQLVSTSYDASKWDKALAANLEALQLALGAGNRALYNDTTAYHGNNLELPYVPFDAPEGFKQKVMLMRYLNTTRENEGNREIIFSSSEGINGAALTARLPHRIIKKSNGTYYDHWEGIGTSVYSVEHFLTVNGLLPENDPDFYDESEWYTSAGLRGKRSSIIKLCTNREPRFYAWVGFDGGDYGSRVYDNKEPLTLDMKDPEKQGYAPSLYNRDFCPSGFLNQKWIHPACYFTAAGAENRYNTATYPIMRLAELYLNIAECYAAKGNVEEACNYLNPIRERAGIPALTSAMVSASGMSIMEWVRNERFCELWNESNRFFDIRRWVIGEQQLGYGKRIVLNAQVEKPTFEEFNQKMPLNFPYTWGRKLYVYPVWYHELARNPQLVQAPGF